MSTVENDNIFSLLRKKSIQKAVLLYIQSQKIEFLLNSPIQNINNTLKFKLLNSGIIDYFKIQCYFREVFKFLRQNDIKIKEYKENEINKLVDMYDKSSNDLTESYIGNNLDEIKIQFQPNIKFQKQKQNKINYPTEFCLISEEIYNKITTKLCMQEKEENPNNLNNIEIEKNFEVLIGNNWIIIFDNGNFNSNKYCYFICDYKQDLEFKINNILIFNHSDTFSREIEYFKTGGKYNYYKIRYINLREEGIFNIIEDGEIIGICINLAIDSEYQRMDTIENESVVRSHRKLKITPTGGYKNDNIWNEKLSLSFLENFVIAIYISLQKTKKFNKELNDILNKNIKFENNAEYYIYNLLSNCKEADNIEDLIELFIKIYKSKRNLITKKNNNFNQNVENLIDFFFKNCTVDLREFGYNNNFNYETNKNYSHGKFNLMKFFTGQKEVNNNSIDFNYLLINSNDFSSYCNEVNVSDLITNNYQRVEINSFPIILIILVNNQLNKHIKKNEEMFLTESTSENKIKMSLIGGIEFQKENNIFNTYYFKKQKKIFKIKRNNNEELKNFPEFNPLLLFYCKIEKNSNNIYDKSNFPQSLIWNNFNTANVNENEDNKIKNGIIGDKIEIHNNNYIKDNSIKNLDLNQNFNFNLNNNNIKNNTDNNISKNNYFNNKNVVNNFNINLNNNNYLNKNIEKNQIYKNNNVNNRNCRYNDYLNIENNMRQNYQNFPYYYNYRYNNNNFNNKINFNNINPNRNNY